jgi:EAL domain-containing protein (putative c-di-GMP-specific phosphodiesterase class I)
MSINLSGRHLLSLAVIDDIRAVLVSTGVDPSRIVIEITETVLLSDLGLVSRHMQQIRELGCQVAIDDFGTGFTSLAHLTTLPIDVIKIDRSMVVRAAKERDQHLLRCVVDTAHLLGLTITAEGVETAEQLELVRRLGCDRVQGYLVARPLEARALVTSLESRHESSDSHY